MVIGSCFPHLLSRLKQQYGYESPHSPAFLSILQKQSTACFKGCIVMIEPELAIRPRTLVVAKSWWWQKSPQINPTSSRTNIFVEHLHLPKTAGTSLSAHLVSEYCATFQNDTNLKKSIGWNERCQWPCSGPRSRYYTNDIDRFIENKISSDINDGAQPLLFLDTELSCVRGQSNQIRLRKEQ